MCAADYIEKLHLTHLQADEPHEITGIVTDSFDGVPDKESTSGFICQTAGSITAGIKYLISMSDASPEAMAAITNIAILVDGVSGILG